MNTCGAGDAYAAGVLWAYLRGQGVSAMGRAGARVASQIINRQVVSPPFTACPSPDAAAAPYLG